MPFKTKILDPNGKEVIPEIKVTSGNGAFGALLEYISLQVSGEEIGSMTITTESDHVYISKMANNTHGDEKPYKHVGLFLLEYAFKASVKKGKQGKIELQAIDASPPFYFKAGFKPRNLPAKTYANMIEKLNKLQKLSLEEQAQFVNAFGKIKIAAAEFLKKKPDEITLDEAEDFGGFSSVANKRFETALKSNQGSRLTEKGCEDSNLQTAMSLTAGMVEKLQLGWDDRSAFERLEDKKYHRNSVVYEILGIRTKEMKDDEQISTENTLSFHP